MPEPEDHFDPHILPQSRNSVLTARSSGREWPEGLNAQEALRAGRGERDAPCGFRAGIRRNHGADIQPRFTQQAGALLNPVLAGWVAGPHERIEFAPGGERGREANDVQVVVRVAGVGAGQIFLKVRHAVVVRIGAGVNSRAAEIGEFPSDGQTVGVELPGENESVCT